MEVEVGMGVSENSGTKYPKMDGENNGKTLFFKRMIWRYHYFRKHPYTVPLRKKRADII